jgi:diguanylate cyclase (GGDEF)-like protein
MLQYKRSIYHRVVLYSLVLLSIGLAQAAVDILTLHEVTQNSMALERNWVQGATLLSDIDHGVEAFRLAEVERALVLGQPGRDRAKADAARQQVTVAEYERSYRALLADSNAAQLEAFDRAWAHYQSDHNRWGQRLGDAVALPDAQLDADHNATDVALSALVETYRTEGLARAAAQTRTAHRTMLLDLVVAVLCVSFVMLMQLGARRDIVAPIQAITEAMTLLAAGIRDTAIPGRERHDEIGAMAAACEVFRLNVVALDHAHETARQAEEQAQLLARHDALTGLPNRRLFSVNLETALARAQKGKSCYALLLIDLDDFKKVNDIQGHQAGDVVLCEVGRRLEASLRRNDTLARLGGDEFAIITQGGADLQEHLEQTKRLAGRLLGIIRRPIEIGDTKTEIGASIGIASFAANVESSGGATDDVTSLLRAADIAMYRAKQSGRFTYRFFEQSMDDEMRAREALERDVAKAIADGAIRPHYQPLVDIGRQRIRGFEALARWTHPVRGAVPPDVFIPIIEQLGLTAELSNCILRHACRDARHWPADICVAINISPHELKDEAMPLRFAKILEEEGLPPQRLEVEVTESALVSDLAMAKAILAALQDQGMTICLDDFGTGYSSLYHLRELKFDKIKIDRSFVQAMRGNAESEKIIDAILGLTGSMNLPVVAEGIEDAVTLRMLTAKGCELGQGYYFGKAMPAASATAALLAQGTEAVSA